MTPADAIGETAPTSTKASAPAGREVLLFGAVYTLVYGYMLLIPGAVFWDDWVLFGASHETIARMFEQASASRAITYLHFLLLGLGMWSYKALTFGLWFAMGLLLSRILARNSLFTDGARVAIVLLFLVLPLNAARVAAINFPYTLCMFLFVLAWHQMERRRILALASFALSFLTASLLVFYALPILDAAYRGGHLASLRAAWRFALRRLDFLLLPFAYYAYHLATFAPKEPYSGYNSNYSLANLLPAMKAQSLDMPEFLRLLDPLALLVLLPLVWWLLARGAAAVRTDVKQPLRRMAAWLTLGLLAFVLGAFPYWIIGKPPTFMEWSSRHQLLLPLGVAMVLVSFAWVLPGRARIEALALAVAASLSFGVTNAYAFLVDAHKQRALMDLIARDPAIRGASVVVFVDKAADLNAIRRSYRFYEWNGMMAQALGDETRFGGNPADVRSYFAGRFDQLLPLHIRASQHKRSANPVVVLAEIHAAPVRTFGRRPGVWRWPPLPELSLKTTRITPDRLRPAAGG